MPIYIDIFLSPVRDNPVAQVATAAVLMLILLDWLFGIFNACVVQHNFSSERMRQGIAHKCSELGFMVVGIIADGTIVGGFDLGLGAPIYITIATYIALMEIGSLLEIFVQMNPALADSPLFKVLASVNDMEEIKA